MKNLVRALASLSIALPLALSTACSGGGGNTGAGTGGDTQTTSGQTSSGETSSGGTSSSSGTTAGTIAWPGTWNVHLAFSEDCDYGLGNVKHMSQTQTNTMTVTSNGQGGLAGDVMGYAQSGTGSASSLTLSGQYPALDDTGAVADNVQANNNITLSIDTVTDATHASGTFSGMFTGQFGESCTVSDGTATFSR